MPRFLLPKLFLLFLSLLLPEPIEAQRSRFTFGRFQLDFSSPSLLTCSTGSDSAAWDETAESIRSGAEKCLRTIQCPALDDQTPYYVGLGNVQCVNRDDGAVGMDFIGGGAMDFNGTVPSLDEDLVEACVRTVLQSSECAAILATYNSKIASPATYYTTGRQYPDEVMAPPPASGGVSDGAVSAKEEDNSTSSNTPMMTFPVLGIAGACFVAIFLGIGVLLAFFLYQKRRRQKRKDAKHQNENNFSNSDHPFDVETALSRSDSLGQKEKLNGGELGRMLDEQSAVIKTTTASATTTILPHQDDHTPTTIKVEADASFETTSSYEGEEGLYETVEVGLQDNVGSYDDTRHINTGLDHNDDGLPVILIPEKSTAFVDSAHLCTLQSFQLIPFTETKSDDVDENNTGQQLTSTPTSHTEHDITRNFCVISASNLMSSSTDLPELAQSSSDDSRMGNRPSNGGESYESSKVEIILGNDDDDCESSTATPTDHHDDSDTTDYEFEPDGYWDPDDNSISTADAAGLSAMGTGEFSFQPSITTTTTTLIKSTTVSSNPTNNKSPPPHEKTTLYNWLCEGPALCTSSSTSSLPDLLAKQPTTPNTDSRVVGRPRTNSYHGISPYSLSATTGV